MKLIITYFGSFIMSTCGYVCPLCNGKEFMEDGLPCTWCNPKASLSDKKSISDEEWMDSVHFGDCCSDRAETDKNVEIKHEIINPDIE